MPNEINVAAVSRVVNVDLIMKKLFWRALFFLIPFFYSIYVSSQPEGKKDCATTCFSSSVISVEEISANCRIYELKVSYSGDCAHALSHYSVAIPCGQITNVFNSENWAQEIGTDPTTRLSGFKIDGIANFGEGIRTSFHVKFTVCSTDEPCADKLKCWQPLVAYKASTCINYETLNVACKSLKASLQHQDVSCFDAADGSLAVLIEDGHEPFTFLWSDNSTAQSLEGVKAGDYTVIVKDALGAELTLSATVAQPEPISLEGTISPATCNGKANGAIGLTVSGGNAPYTFSWSNGANTKDITALAAGQYFVTVKDAGNCTATARFTVSNASALSLSVSMTAPECNSPNGILNVSVTGGQAPYSFQWSNGETSEDLSDIPAGLYSVTVTDQGGCSAQRSVFLKENNTLTVKASSTPASCAGDATGSIDLTVSGGTAPYTYTWSTGGYTEDLSNLESGYYTVKVVDGKGCAVTANYTVTTKTFQVPRTVVQPACEGESNGSITLLEPTGGTAPYTYQWSNGETGPALTDLSAGSYTVTITDATGCSKTLSLSISDPAPIVATASVSSNACNEEGSYLIDLEVSGGTKPYSFQWSNGPSTEDVQELSGGTYTVVITDGKGCSISEDVIVVAGPALACLIDDVEAPRCGSTDNSISTSVIDADSYQWSVASSDNTWAIAAANSPSVTYTAGSANSSATFTLTVTKDGCSKTCLYTISACVPDEGGHPGGEEPGDGDGETCADCFSTAGASLTSSDGCRTFEIEVSTTGRCARELSHWTIAIPCGDISNYSNSQGWKMEVGLDPTTGMYGLKVDDISSFGKEAGSFTVRFTLCNMNCDLRGWDPAVAYKAGQCVATENVVLENLRGITTSVAAYPNPFTDVIHFEWQASTMQVNLDIVDQYGNVVLHSSSAERDGKGNFIDLHASSLPKGMYYYRLTVDGSVHNGKLSKR